MALRPLLLVVLIAFMPAPAAQARDAEENVTWAWAQVLRASPVYRMVQVPTTEQRCDSPWGNARSKGSRIHDPGSGERRPAERCYLCDRIGTVQAGRQLVRAACAGRPPEAH